MSASTASSNVALTRTSSCASAFEGWYVGFTMSTWRDGGRFGTFLHNPQRIEGFEERIGEINGDVLALKMSKATREDVEELRRRVMDMEGRTPARGVEIEADAPGTTATRRKRPTGQGVELEFYKKDLLKREIITIKNTSGMCITGWKGILTYRTVRGGRAIATQQLGAVGTLRPGDVRMLKSGDYGERQAVQQLGFVHESGPEYQKAAGTVFKVELTTTGGRAARC